jgi:1,2-diacylglycerol 3-alpha-glucosyltransferase
VKKPRVGVIFHRFGPYHCARLQGTLPYCEVIAIELGSETSEYAWSRPKIQGAYSQVTLFPDKDSRAVTVRMLSKAVYAALDNASPDVVAIPGWSDKGALSALSWCLQRGKPAVLMSESTVEDEPRVWWKEQTKRRIVRLYSSALVGGQRHIDYLLALGMPRDRIFTGYDVVDNDYFRRQVEETRAQSSEVRQKYGLPERYFLASARFIAKKNLFTLLRAYSGYRKAADGSAWDLVLLGDGRLKSDLCRLISDLHLGDSVVLPGFKQYDELPIYYALAKAFVHASTSEPWGLVVNEAMASGLPVIVSNRCGCVPDLVKDGINGFTFDPDSDRQLAGLMLRVSTESQLSAMGNASGKIISEWGTDRFGAGIKAVAEAALRIGWKRPTLLQRVLLGLLFHA